MNAPIHVLSFGGHGTVVANNAIESVNGAAVFLNAPRTVRNAETTGNTFSNVGKAFWVSDIAGGDSDRIAFRRDRGSLGNTNFARLLRITSNVPGAPIGTVICEDNHFTVSPAGITGPGYYCSIYHDANTILGKVVCTNNTFDEAIDNVEHVGNDPGNYECILENNRVGSR